MKLKIFKGLCAFIAASMILSNGTAGIKASGVNVQEAISKSDADISERAESDGFEAAGSENYYISEDNYKENMDNIVMPYIESRLESGYIDGADNAELYYEKYKADNSRGNIVISHGYTESLEKYHEMIYYFLNNGYNVFGIEHRSHGRSGSLGVADKTQIYVESFEDYITDFKNFMDKVVVPNSEDKDLYLYAHSMGGCIATGFLEEYPEYFQKAVLNAPMLEVHTGNVPDFLAKIIVKSAVAFGQGGKYVIGKKPYSPVYDFVPSGTSSENRWNYINDIVNENEEFQRGEASYQWLNESFKATKRFTNKENASKVTIPVMLFQADNDTYVKDGGQNKFAEYAENCELVRIDDARHEIYLERDEIQKTYLKQVFEFYNN
ncbi:MAG: alpha/beta fold hydrolase [Clostridium sp.]